MRIFQALIISLLMLMSAQDSFADTGLASWYSEASCKREGTSGVWTASGLAFNDNGMTCAIRSRDFFGWYKVTNLKNGKSVIVMHNDYGPNKKLARQGRIIDLSKSAFKKITGLGKGLIKVRVQRLKVRS